MFNEQPNMNSSANKELIESNYIGNYSNHNALYDISENSVLLGEEGREHASSLLALGKTESGKDSCR